MTIEIGPGSELPGDEDTTKKMSDPEKKMKPRLLDDRYQLQDRIGLGGFGEVWRAFDRKLGRVVAIKRLRNIHLREEAKRGLEEEAKVNSRLVHKNIIQVHEFSDCESPHLIMEYVDGETLHDKLASHAQRGTWIGRDDALYIFQQLLEGLGFAHEKNIVHRDIKPANLMITKGGMLKVGDFGLARHLAPNAGEPAYVRTNLGGTLHFMSPEQACGSTLDFRTDVFSAGIVGYILFTGRHPFAHPSTVPSIIELIRDEAYPARGDFTGKETWTQQEKKVILRMLEKNREDRFPSAQDAIEPLSFDKRNTICPECQATTQADHRFCFHCGSRLYRKTIKKEEGPTINEIETKSTEADLLVEEGLELLKKIPKDWKGAIAAFQAALDCDPNCVSASRHLTVLFKGRGLYEQAIEAATYGLTIATNSRDRCILLDARGLAFSHQKLFIESISDFSKALELFNDDPKLWSHRAESLVQMGKLEEARLDIDRALELAPRLQIAIRLRDRLERE